MSQWTDEVLTAPEAARLKGVAESSIRRAIQDGRLLGLRKGHVYLVRRGDLDAWQPIGHRPSRRATGAGPRLAADNPYAASEAVNGAASRRPLSSATGGQDAAHTATARAARIMALQQEFADLPLSTQEFLYEKHADMVRDE